MQIAIIGLGRMGANIARRLLANGHDVVVFNRSTGPVEELATLHAKPAHSLEELAKLLSPPRAAWVMLPAGEPTESTVAKLAALFQGGDTIIDGGNTNFHDDVRRAEALTPKRVHYIDAGTSGGIWGLQEGYCLMVGGEDAGFRGGVAG